MLIFFYYLNKGERPIMQKTMEALKNMDICAVDPDTLADIRDVKFNAELPLRERLPDFIKQIKNPYLYRCGKAIVKVSFADTEETLEDRLESYISAL